MGIKKVALTLRSSCLRNGRNAYLNPRQKVGLAGPNTINRQAVRDAWQQTRTRGGLPYEYLRGSAERL
jgi:hypothetical protein